MTNDASGPQRSSLFGSVDNGPLSSSSYIDQQRPSVTSSKISVANLEELVLKHDNQDFSEQGYKKKPEHSDNQINSFSRLQLTPY